MKLIDLNKLTRQRADQQGLTYQVGASGNTQSHIAIIAEAPGEREAKMNMPLCGGSGALLWEVMRKYGINRNDCYVTNVCKRQVSLSESDKTVREKLTKEEELQWGIIAIEELKQLPNLRYVVLLGNVALRQLTGNDGINNWRGSVLEQTLPGDDRPLYFMVINNPAQAKHNPNEEIIFRYHIAKLDRLLRGSYAPYTIQYNVLEDADSVVALLHQMEREGDKNETPISYDIEVISGETACIGIANSAHVGYCCPFRTIRDNIYGVDDESKIRKQFAKFFANQQLKFIAQNGGFDASWLWFKDRIKVHANWFDTMLAHHCLYPSLPHGLGFLCTQYTDHPYYKDEKNEWREGGDINTFWNYNITDCCITWQVQSKLHSELESQRLEDFFFGHIMRLQPHLVRMIVGGVKIHQGRKDEFVAHANEVIGMLVADFHHRVRELTGLDSYAPNPQSDQQVADLFFNKLGLSGKGRSVDKDNRNLILANPRTSEEKAAVVRLVGDIRKESKFNSTYAQMRADDDYRIRTEYKQAGTTSAPGRLSSASPLWGTGGNLQNIPQRAYSMFIMDEGYCGGYFDLEQAEARVVGWKAKIPSWIDQYERARAGEDIDTHRLLASEMFNIPYAEVPKDDRDSNDNETIRYYAKRSRHGFNYRLGPDTFSIKNKLPLARSIELHRLYHRANPELATWWQAVEREVNDKRMLFNAYGRRLLFLTSNITYDMINTAIAFYPQSTVGDKVNRVIYQSESDPRWPWKARILLNIHDALICIAPHHKIEQCLSIMKRYAEEPIMVDGEELIIPASCKKTVPDDDGYHTWAKLEKVKL